MAESWMVVNIGNKEYAIGSSYMVGSLKLNSCELVKESNKPFIRGIYRMVNSEVPVINGRKVACELTVEEESTEATKEWQEIKFDVERWIDYLDLRVFMGESIESELVVDIDQIIERIKSLKVYNSNSVLKSRVKLIDILTKNSVRAKAVIDKHRKELKLSDNSEYMNSERAYSEVEQIKANIEKYVYPLVNNITNDICKELEELVIIISTKHRLLGLTVDSVKSLSGSDYKLEDVEKTYLSAGTLKAKNREYNIISLSKLIKTI